MGLNVSARIPLPATNTSETDITAFLRYFVFERYTEKARRVIFFARYEASQFGSPYIETEHVLLAVLREDKRVSELLPRGAPEQIRGEIESASPARKKTSTTVDLPLSNESKRALAYGAEEADRLAHKHIGSEHLLLGLLREPESFGARLLNRHGVDLERARTFVAKLPAGAEGSTQPVVFIHGAAWDSQYVQNMSNDLRRYCWEKRDWKPRSLLVEKQTGKIMFYQGESYDSERFQLGKDAWTKDLCAICRWELAETADPEHNTGYTNGQEWVCVECHDKFMATANNYDPST